ncbi:MAG: acyltransferase, partial [Magnetococcales bacterium]|nr:acyltransferase [Magnetococcales bacterium]
MSGTPPSEAMRYRADIDGLRAIAVLSVVFFHLSRSTLPGGYLGVDMFFVISGYLITSIIWRETQDNTFSILRFYDRRIRRILPALILSLFVTTLSASYFLLPADLVEYGKSLLATLAFVANIHFWLDSGYFGGVAEERPLLHMWSLGIEEQFYLLFPLLIAFFGRFMPRGATPTITLLTFGSLALNFLAIFLDGANPAFYLLPTRAWELGLGTLLVLSPRLASGFPGSGRVRTGKEFPGFHWHTTAAVTGGILVGLGLFHPGLLSPLMPVAVPVVAGTALLILTGQHGCSALHRFLSLPPVVFIGLISYSLYLWHWPIIVLGKYYLVREFNVAEKAAVLASAIVCATASWHFVERPFRSRDMPIRMVRSATGAGVAVLIAIAIAFVSADGLPGRFSPEIARINEAVGTNYRCPVSDYIALGHSRACVMNLPSRNPADAEVILLGNSHAQMYAPLVASILAERGLVGLLVPVNSCMPTITANVSRDCVEVARRNLEE